MSTIARELDYSTPQEHSTPEYEWPFEANGDFGTFIITRFYKQTREGFLQDKLLGRYRLGEVADREFPAAILINTSRPSLTPTSLFSFSRRFAIMPPTQSVEDSLMLTRPDPGLSSYPGILGDYRIFKPDSTLKKFDAYAKQTVSSDTGAPGGFYPTGGTYTLTFGGNTTGALNYNDAAATVETALDALTSVTNRGGVAVSGSYNSVGGLIIVFSDYAAATLDLSSLVVTSGTATSTVTLQNNGYTQAVLIQSTLASEYVGGVSSGTFTVTIGGDTTSALSYNSSAATIATALNALASVTNRGGCTVTGLGWDSGVQKIRFTINFANAVMTAASTSLTPAGSVATPSITDAVGRTQKVVFSGGTSIRDLYVASHGLSTSDTLYIRSGSTYYSEIAGAKFSLPDANTVRLIIAASDSYASAGTITEVGKRTKQGYEPGSDPKLVTIETRFSLSAITPDTYQGADATFLQEIFEGNTAINYRVGESTRWPSPDSPIRSLTTTKVSAVVL